MSTSPTYTLDQPAATSHASWRQALVLGLVLAAIAGASVLVMRTPTLRQAFHLATSRQPERFSELGFVNYGALPKQVVAGKSYDIGFAIANHEAGEYDYRYEVVVWQNGQTHTLARDHVTLVDGDQKTVFVTFVPTDPGASYRISIYLIDKNQEIDVRLAS